MPQKHSLTLKTRKPNSYDYNRHWALGGGAAGSMRAICGRIHPCDVVGDEGSYLHLGPTIGTCEWINLVNLPDEFPPTR